MHEKLIINPTFAERPEVGAGYIEGKMRGIVRYIRIWAKTIDRGRLLQRELNAPLVRLAQPLAIHALPIRYIPLIYFLAIETSNIKAPL
jgi:hypothetical protein